MDDHFGIAAAAEDVSGADQLFHQPLEVVDLTVEHHRHAAVLVVERLLSGGQVDDGKAPVPQPDSRLDVQPAAVRAAVVLRLVHSVQQAAIYLAPAFGVENPNDAAHVIDPSRAPARREAPQGLADGAPAGAP
jgi:hypothetical protein